MQNPHMYIHLVLDLDADSVFAIKTPWPIQDFLRHTTLLVCDFIVNIKSSGLLKSNVGRQGLWMMPKLCSTPVT